MLRTIMTQVFRYQREAADLAVMVRLNSVAFLSEALAVYSPLSYKSLSAYYFSVARIAGFVRDSEKVIMWAILVASGVGFQVRHSKRVLRPTDLARSTSLIHGEQL